ncbi:MAG: CoA pyrophosphatase [Candidatus Bathyarchaeia archaeon]
MGSIEAFEGRLRRIEDPKARAAVAVLLSRPVEGLEVLLVKRASNPLDPWSGDIAFPGGRRRSTDNDLLETALRETLEETRIDLREHRLLGSLNPVASETDAGMIVQPFVFLSNSRPRVELSHELCSHMWVPIDTLKKSRGMAKVRGGVSPAYIVNGEVIWGITYRVLEELLSLIEPS